MIITTTQTFTIDPQYEPLINSIIDDNGGTLEGETTQDAIIRILGNRTQGNTLGFIVPSLESYFGKQGQAQFDALVELLNNGALTTAVTVTD